MKKVTAFIALLLLTFTLASCQTEEEPEPFSLEDFSILEIQTLLNESIQYNSIYNVDTENTRIFGLTKTAIQMYELSMLEEDQETCGTIEDDFIFFVQANIGNLMISSRCYVIDGVDTEVTEVELVNQFQAITNKNLYDELVDLF